MRLAQTKHGGQKRFDALYFPIGRRINITTDSRKLHVLFLRKGYIIGVSTQTGYLMSSDRKKDNIF